MSRLSVASADKVNSTTEQLMKEFTQRIVANPPGVCPVDMQLAFLKVCHAQTCGKCVPCRVGLGQLERLLEKVLDNEATMETLELIEETAENIKILLTVQSGLNPHVWCWQVWKVSEKTIFHILQTTDVLDHSNSRSRVSHFVRRMWIFRDILHWQVRDAVRMQFA